MRTTVTLDDDVAAMIAQVQRQHGVGVSAAVNQLISRGLVVPVPTMPFVQRTSRMQARIDVTNVAEALEVLDGASAP